jgi:hypothetical protein
LALRRYPMAQIGFVSQFAFLPRLPYRPFVAAVVVGSLAAVVGCGGSNSQNSNSGTTTPAPVISSLSPASGPVGTSVTIAGSNFGASQGTSTVTFNGTAATPASWSATSIAAPVPSGATTGNVVVAVGGQASNGVSFTVTVPAPAIASLSPTSGPVGTAVTIAGSNFGASQGTSTVTFNGTAATPASWTATNIVAPVPSGATTGNVVVTVGGQVSNSLAFTVGATSGSSVIGTASLGAPIANAPVTLVDANGDTSMATTAADGTFTVDTGGLTPPFLVKIVTASSSGTFPSGTTLYSVSADAKTSTNINVHALSDLIVRSYYSAQGIDVDNAFANPTVSANAAPTPLAVQTMASAVIQAMQLWFSAAGISVTPAAPSSGSINLISSPFIANDTGLDSVLHSITTETVNAGSGAVTAMTVAAGTITESIAPAYSSGTATMVIVTTNSSTGISSSEAITGLALTTAQQSAIGGIDAQLVAFENTANSDGAGLTGSDLLPYIASDYLNDGVNATEYAGSLASDLAGVTLSNLQVSNIRSVDTSTNVADVVVALTQSEGGISQNATQEFIFKLENSNWLIYGDQRAGQVAATAQSRTSQGAPSLGAGVSNGIYIDTEVDTPATLGVTKVTVSGGGNIWNGTATSTLTQGATVISNGQSIDDFYLLSQPLGSNISQFPAPGTQFTFNLTAPSGNLQYSVPSNAFTTETVGFSGVSNNSGSGPLSAVVGKTLAYQWTLPTTYAIGQVALYAYVADGTAVSPATHTCEIDGPALTAASTSGSIAIPANMSACGLSDAIAAVQIFLEVDGVNGEEAFDELSYPY